jgi:hypothetical protein
MQFLHGSVCFFWEKMVFFVWPGFEKYACLLTWTELFLQAVEKKLMLVFDGRIFDVLEFCFNSYGGTIFQTAWIVYCVCRRKQ